MSPSRRRRRWPRRVVFLGLVSVGVVLGGLAWVYVRTPLPPDVAPSQSSLVCSAVTEHCDSATALARFTAGEDRSVVDFDILPPVLVEAVLAAEDRSFFQHDGVDPSAVIRAAFADLRSTSVSQGGSTITQQYVKNVYLTAERTWDRKVTEAVLAVKLERELTKEEILARYLNTVYFGRGSYGVAAASQVYFGHGVETVDLAEAALLAGLIRSPETADPTSAPSVAAARRRSVLDAMVETGAVDAGDATAAAETPLDPPHVVARSPRDASGVILVPGVGQASAHFVEAVRQEVVELLGPGVYTAGLRVHTTIDPAIQAAAVAAVGQHLPDDAGPDAAVVVVDGNGAVRALVGGRDFAVSQVDLARGVAGGGSGRQPGSLFKPVVLVAALESGRALDDEVAAPSRLDLDGWVVANADGVDHGRVDLVTALARSYNTPYAALGADVGPDVVASTAERLGVSADLTAVPSLTLGTSEVSVLDMAVLYETLATGVRADPHLVTHIESATGETLWSRDPVVEQVLDPEVVADVGVALRAVVTDGTGAAAAGVDGAIGKTGTSQDAHDAWFAGSACGLGAAVWVGHVDQRPMSDVSGGGAPTRIWADVLGAAC